MHFCKKKLHPQKISHYTVSVRAYSVETLDTDGAVQRMLPPISSPQQDFDEGQSNNDEDIFAQQPLPGGVTEQVASSDVSSHHSAAGTLHLELQKSSSTQSTSEVETEDEYMYRRHLMAGFEAMYEEVCMDNSQSEEEKDTIVVQPDSDLVLDPRASKPCDLSSTHELEEVSQEERGGSEVAEGMEEKKKDVEEGEVSDSSDETAGASEQVVTIYH